MRQDGSSRHCSRQSGEHGSLKLRKKSALPYATNSADDVRTYFEDSGGARPPVLFYTGFADPLEVASSSRLARALGGEFRLIFADHRGQGGSDKPREPSAYGLPTRVAAAPEQGPAGVPPPRRLRTKPARAARTTVTRAVKEAPCSPRWPRR